MKVGIAQIWGVLNVTPDSFSDGGAFLAPADALARARDMLAEGADVIDVGGASSRPAGAAYGTGASTVPEEQELARVLPVVEALAKEGARISIDTTSALVADRCLRAGARIVNDVSCGASSHLLEVAARARAELVVMHNRGRGEVSGNNVAYSDVAQDVNAELARAVARAVSCGIEPGHIWVDPGLGFAKTPAQSMTLLGDLSRCLPAGHRILVGASRKAFLGAHARSPSGQIPDANHRLGASVAAVVLAVQQGASAVRVHDVLASRQAVLIAAAARAAGASS